MSIVLYFSTIVFFINLQRLSSNLESFCQGYKKEKTCRNWANLFINLLCLLIKCI